MDYWIAVVDDEPLSLTNAKNLLGGQNMRVSCLRSGSDLLKFMEKNTPDLLLIDILMPEMDGFETYHALRQLERKKGRPQTPVIFLTGESNRETERRGLNAGASDFIRKPFDRDILVKRIKNSIKNSRMIESLTEEATLDKLTGFLNKSSGTERVEKMCQDHTGALMIFDLDNFKLVNDIFGHDMGDNVLVSFSEIIRDCTRAEDVICRIGGDEFMGFIADITESSAVDAITERLNHRFMLATKKLMGEEHGLPLGVSVGAALAPKHSTDYHMLFRYADSALYKVKINGKHGCEVYDPNVIAGDPNEDLSNAIIRITRIMEERGNSSGALLLGREDFALTYRFVMRFMKRQKKPVNSIIFSMSSEERGEIFSEMAAEFAGVLKNNLRKTDIIYQSRPGQFFVVLPELTEAYTPQLINRILGKWDNTGYGGKAKVRYLSSVLSAGE